ncbi:MAG: hypothetical protein OEQ25_17360 [Gammaproteobacteria bacterium]|nr:hypothetical protein [Gammaproteobacteria bacterium]
MRTFIQRGIAVVIAMLATHAAAQEGALQGGWVMDVRGPWEGLVATDAAQQVVAEFDRSVDDPSMRCVAPGLIRTAESRAPIEIVEQDHQIFILYESFNVIRRIHMASDEAPDWMPSSPVGYSVGAWHGDELAVETTRLTPHLLNDDGFPFSGGPGARIVERYRPSGDRLTVEFTVEDPVNLHGPATRTLTFDRVADSELLHFFCDPLDATGWRLPATGDSLRDLLQWLDLRPPIPE